MKKSLLSVLALSAASALTLAGCAAPPSATTSPAATGSASASAPESSAPAETDFTACMVSDAGGFDDKSFNETAFNGMMQAKDELGIQTKQIESNAEGEYAGNVQSMIDANCNIVITVGFAQGISYYNEQKGADVKLIGWDEAKQDGQFVGGNNPFGDVPGGKNTASTLIAQGADIILPVAGPAGLGALQAAKESGGKVNAIWVDTDGFISAPEFGPQIMTSVQKGMDVAVFEAIKAALEGTFSSDPYVGTLENDGVSLAPFHDFEDKVSDELKSELEQIKADIISGTITITSPSQPK